MKYFKKNIKLVKLKDIILYGFSQINVWNVILFIEITKLYLKHKKVIINSQNEM